MRHTISVLVENKFGVLARISGLFSARGFNIDSLAVGETEDPSVSCMTIIVNAENEKILEQIKKQLNKLIDVISVVDLTNKDYFERELIFVKLGIDKTSKQKIDKLIKEYDVQILHKAKDYVIIQATLDKSHIEEVLDSLKKFKIQQLVRTGRIAIQK